MSTSNSPIVIAYSGGLDTSFCIPWLKNNLKKEVITVTIDTGGIDKKDAGLLENRALKIGAIENHLICLLYTSDAADE